MNNFNWKDSEGHLFLLSKFIHAQETKYFYNNQKYWERILSESPQKAIERFIEEEMLIHPRLDFLVSYKYKATELKGMLRQYRMPFSGKKDELANRIIQVDKEAIEKLVSDIELLVCTQAGREIAEQYKSSEQEIRFKIEQQVFDCVTKRLFYEASLLAATYIEKTPESIGLGSSWKRTSPEVIAEIVKQIFNRKPEILSKLEDVNLEPLQIGAAMMEIWGESTATKWLPTNFKTGLLMDNVTSARMLIFNATSINNLRQYEESGIKFVEVLGAPNSCQFCKEIAGKRFTIGEAPTLPNPNCTHELGCRCLYLACVE